MYGVIDSSSRELFERNRIRVVVVAEAHGTEPARAFHTAHEHDETGAVVLRRDEWVDLSPQEETPVDGLAVLDVPDHIARVVYETLRDRYEPQLADDLRLLRSDYDREAGRVDRLLGVVSTIVLR